MNSLIRHKGWTWGFRTTILLYFVVLIVLPILGVYYNSFSLGIGSFVESIMDPIAWKSVILTLKLAVIATLINVLLGTMIAWVLIRYKFPGKALLNSLVDLPFALPTAVGGLMILLLLGPGSLIGGLAESLGFEIVFHQPAIVIAMVFVTFPFVIRAVQPLLEELDASEEEAAYTMGAKPSRVFLQVILPSMSPGMIGGGCWPSPGRSLNSERLCWWRAIFRGGRWCLRYLFSAKLRVIIRWGPQRSRSFS